MNKIKLLFVLLAIIMVQKNARAQQSMVPDVSEAYLNKLIAIAKANYPTVRSYENKINVAKSNVNKANVSFLDAITVSYVYQPKVSTVYDGQSIQQQFNGFQAGVFFNLGAYLEKPSDVRAAKQQLEIANNDQEEYLLLLTNNVKKRYYTYIQNVDNLKLLTQSCLDAENVLTDIKHRFEKGEATFDTYTTAQLTLTTRYQAKITAEANTLIAKADLEELLGEKLEDIK